MSQISKSKEEIFTLKNKLLELERQSNEYKTKLDGLRRAKATTVIKFEKEYVNSNNNETIRSEKSKSCDKCDELELTIENQRKSNHQLKKSIEQKDIEKRQQQQQQIIVKDHQQSCDECDDFQRLILFEQNNQIELKKQIQIQREYFEKEKENKLRIQRSLEMYQNEFVKQKHLCEDLQKQKEQYQNAFEQMKKEHQQKINDLAQREEEAKKQVTTWEQMYREWMATMETRVNNLQINN